MYYGYWMVGYFMVSAFISVAAYVYASDPETESQDDITAGTVAAFFFGWFFLPIAIPACFGEWLRGKYKSKLTRPTDEKSDE